MNQYRCFSKLLVFLYLLSYAGALHHVIFIKHQYCLNHDHFIHVESTSVNPYLIPEQKNNPLPEDLEDNCFTWQIFSKIISILICFLPFLLSPHSFFSFCKNQASFFSKTVLNLAPKHSPPIYYSLI